MMVVRRQDLTFWKMYKKTAVEYDDDGAGNLSDRREKNCLHF